mmetsp:Transcript_7771/g.10164  ORF Transcript_7771/g.10164 Transcript_7771/m.10164 type:complete len:216 (+) Transcript_7771:2121-2768(+)
MLFTFDMTAFTSNTSFLKSPITSKKCLYTAGFFANFFLTCCKYRSASFRLSDLGLSASAFRFLLFTPEVFFSLGSSTLFFLAFGLEDFFLLGAFSLLFFFFAFLAFFSFFAFSLSTSLCFSETSSEDDDVSLSVSLVSGLRRFFFLFPFLDVLSPLAPLDFAFFCFVRSMPASYRLGFRLVLDEDLSPSVLKAFACSSMSESDPSDSDESGSSSA